MGKPIKKIAKKVVKKTSDFKVNAANSDLSVKFVKRTSLDLMDSRIPCYDYIL
jgi:hypothetical protein